MTRIYLIRHGATGIKERDQNAKDPLNQEGQRMLKALAGRLVGEGILMIYASPFQRAWQSAKLLEAELRVPLERRSELEEIVLPKNPLELQNPWLKQEREQLRELLEGTWDQLENLMEDTLSLSTGKGKKVAWVCHGNLIRAILVGALQLPLAALGHLEVDLASLTTLQWDEKYEYFTLKLFNDTCHI